MYACMYACIWCVYNICIYIYIYIYIARNLLRLMHTHTHTHTYTQLSSFLNRLDVRHSIGSLVCHGLFSADTVIAPDQLHKLINACLDTQKISKLITESCGMESATVTKDKSVKHGGNDDPTHHVMIEGDDLAGNSGVDDVKRVLQERLGGKIVIVDLEESVSRSESKLRKYEVNVDMVAEVRARVLHSEGYVLVSMRTKDCRDKTKTLRQALDDAFYEGVRHALQA